jgi:hypothetical protein
MLMLLAGLQVIRSMAAFCAPKMSHPVTEAAPYRPPKNIRRCGGNADGGIFFRGRNDFHRWPHGGRAISSSRMGLWNFERAVAPSLISLPPKS